MSKESLRIEADWAFQQLEALGYVTSQGQGRARTFGITDLGMDHAAQIMVSRHDVMERLLIMLYCAAMNDFVREKD